MKHNSTQITEARIAVALYLKQQIDQVERDTPGDGTAQALRAIAKALQGGAFDHAIEPAELVIEHTPSSSIGTRNDAVEDEIEDAVSTTQQTTKEEHSQPAIDMNQLAEEYLT